RDNWTTWGDESAPTVEPRGRVHKGYEGGAIERPPADDEPVEDTVAARYTAGQSIREISESLSMSIRQVRLAVDRAGIQVRGRGRRVTADVVAQRLPGRAAVDGLFCLSRGRAAGCRW